jgi:hypothetical protein
MTAASSDDERISSARWRVFLAARRFGGNSYADCVLTVVTGFFAVALRLTWM